MSGIITPIPNGGNIAWPFSVPKCSVCGKTKISTMSGIWTIYNCPDMCDKVIANCPSPKDDVKMPCDCDTFSVLMVTGCKNKNHY
jgi:hypothetical protein